MYKLSTFYTQKEFVHQSTQVIERIIVDAIKKNGEARIALSGGSSPKETYRHLSQSVNIEWDKVHIFMADERYVPEDSNESNAKMIQKELIKHAPNAQFYPFDTDLKIDQAVENYEKKLRSIYKDFLFDLVILGLGNDGHIASLFPNIPELDEKEKWVIHTKAENYSTEDRLTLTFPAILKSGKILFLIQGNKKKTIERWLNEKRDFHELPAGKILSHPSLSIYHFDPEI